MNWLAGIRFRFRALFQKRELDQQMDEEMRSHIEMQTEANIEAGMNAKEARFAALRQFGWVESIKENCREQRGVTWIENLFQDVRYGTRMLLKNPAFTAVAVTTMALGIGANTAIFSLVNALLLRPLPFREPGRLVWVANPTPGEGISGMNRLFNLRDWREMNHSFEDLGGYVAFFNRMNYILKENGDPMRLQGAAVTGNFLDVLGVQPRLGRNFNEEESQRNGPKALIITDQFWRRRFGADPGIVGHTISINNDPWTVVGVLPPSFDFSTVFTPGARPVDFLRPFPNIGDGWGNLMAVMGRLKPRVTLVQAQAEFDLLNNQLQSAHPERGRFSSRVIPLRENISGQFRQPFIILTCAVGCVLLIACANLSNLLLARAAARRKEIAVRIALGAGRWRLIRQMLTETLLLSCCGAALGLPLAYLATNAMARSNALSIPLLATARVDSAALSFTLLTAFFSGLLFGIVPAFQLSQSNLQSDLKEAGRGSSHGRHRVWMRESLVALEVALACVLLIGAGLLIRSFARLLEIDLGFRPENVVAWRVFPAKYAAQGRETGFYQELIRRIEVLPGVESVGTTGGLPLGFDDIVKLRAKGQTYNPSQIPTAFVREVDQGYFTTLRIPLRAGRVFESHDNPYDLRDPPETVEVVVINEKLAHFLWPGKEAIGQTVLMDDRDPPLICKVVGVVGNVRQKVLENEGGPEIYLLGSGGELVVRTTGSVESVIPTVRAVLRQINPNMPVNDFKVLSKIVDQVISPKRLITILLGLFSLLALLLASVGIYGVIAYAVSQRTQEIGIRLALGSSKAAVLRLITQQGMRVAIFGCALGLMLALALTRVFQTLLFGVSPTDPLTFLGSGLLLLLVALLACWLPALRAAQLDPITALRQE